MVRQSFQPAGGSLPDDIFFARSNLSYFANYDRYNMGPACLRVAPGSFDIPSGGLAKAKRGTDVSKAFDSCPNLPEGSPCDTRWIKLDIPGSRQRVRGSPCRREWLDMLQDLLQAQWWPQIPHWEPAVIDPPCLGAATGRPCGVTWDLGSYIEQGAPATAAWPTGRYAQYRVNMWSMKTMLNDPCPVLVPPAGYPPDVLRGTPILYYVTLFYEGVQGSSVYLPILLKDVNP